jgi:hypothetical protein
VNSVICTAGAVIALGFATALPAATFKTANFEVIADSPAIAREVAESAEKWRTTLAEHWLERPLKAWNYCCRIEVKTQESGGTGWTTYQFVGGKVHRVGIRMQGSLDRLLEYVLPHELTHAVLSTATGVALPRWADEGAAMLSESQSQKLRQNLVVEQLIHTGDVIPLRQMLQMMEYPPNKAKLYAFYAQSLTLAEFLIAQRGPVRFLEFVNEGHSGEWDAAIHLHYEIENVEALQGAWSEWVLKKTGNRNSRDPQQIAAAE